MPPGCILAGMRAAALFCLLAVGAAPAGAMPPPGWQNWPVAATSTHAQVYFPATLPSPAPVVVFLHGSGSSPEAWQSLLAPVADQLHVVLVVPKSVEFIGFGVGADDLTVSELLARLRTTLAVDETRIALAGHSAGGAYALMLAYASVGRFSGVFTLGSPYRTVLALADPDYVAPWRYYYGDLDPNYSGGNAGAMIDQLARLGVRHEEEIGAGYGHNDWPAGTLERGFGFLLAQRYRTPAGCVPGEHRLCLAGGRFAVTAHWATADGASGMAGTASARTGDSGLFWFFSPENWELQVKVLDACALNQHYWLFAAGTTDVEYDLVVEDLQSGSSRTYHHPRGTPAPATTDTSAFATCP